ncbi:hypothetical protein [Fulvivirga lutea]|uniref:Uncharacterized protein n=1 Tax=Fulvivirga lutea TaxID=2810512 RepID=A0A974WIV4_9BACT|nr:hypothetical protein [Fulvivirga lutea]QSE98573.1 hypothetical protein JR347_05690 [Fulvivirga lutea]
MLSFFRINDPYRLLVIFIIMLGLRLPAMISDSILTLPELNFMLVGEKMTNGADLYSEIWDAIGPLSALVYFVIDWLFGRSQLAYQIVAFFISCFQVYIFNRFMLSSRAFSENTYVPGLIYGVLCSLSYDMLTLTPFLMGLTFILLSLEKIFSHIEVRAKRDEDILNIGLYVGLATVIYLPFSIFALGILVIFIFFTGTVGRRYALMTFGFALPMMIAGGYFYLTDRFTDFVFSFLSPFTEMDKVWYLSLKHTLILFAVPLAFLLLSLVRLIQGARLTNYQARLTQTMFVWFLFGGFFIVLSDYNVPSAYIVLIPAITFYIAHYYLAKKRGFFTEFSFLFFILLIVATNVLSYYSEYFEKFYDDSNYKVQSSNQTKIKNKRILVLDEDLRPYNTNKSATPFLSWQLAEPVFTDLNYYDNLTIIYEGIKNDPPEVIIDPDNHLTEVLNKVPYLADKYYRAFDGNYYLKN